MTKKNAAQRLKRYRSWRQLSKAKLAVMLGCHDTYVAKLEAGRVGTLGVSIAFRIEELSADWPQGPIRAREWAETG